jgi:thioredoxin reductase
MYDLIIIGGGPTGITTSIYAARESFSVLISEEFRLTIRRLRHASAAPRRLSGGVAREAASRASSDWRRLLPNAKNNLRTERR